MTDTDSTPTYPRVLVRSEQSSGRIGVIESLMPAGAAGPPLHTHDFDEAFYVLEGELTFRLDGKLVRIAAGQLAFAPGGEPHTFTNRGPAPARFLIACTPAGFEREFARRAARNEGIDPPEWALKEIPAVIRVGPRIGEEDDE
ncbi:MAG: cupin domain-containing protein [Solirubrobacterales bacterium]|nr:cupin domain-containing protein [Solirubrobacterales bacterium]